MELLTVRTSSYRRVWPFVRLFLLFPFLIWRHEADPAYTQRQGATNNVISHISSTKTIGQYHQTCWTAHLRSPDLRSQSKRYVRHQRQSSAHVRTSSKLLQLRESFNGSAFHIAFKTFFGFIDVQICGPSVRLHGGKYEV